MIAGYCGKSKTLDEVLADFAEAYGSQTERDHALLVKAIKAGRVPAVEGVQIISVECRIMAPNGLSGDHL